MSWVTAVDIDAAAAIQCGCRGGSSGKANRLHNDDCNASFEYVDSELALFNSELALFMGPGLS